MVNVFSRGIVGWKAARTMATSLVLDALNMAAWAWRGRSTSTLVRSGRRIVLQLAARHPFRIRLVAALDRRRRIEPAPV